MADQPNKSGNHYAVLGFGGAGIGLLVGFVMRPAVMGIKIPLAVLTSSYPADAPYKSELLTHLATYLAAGAGIGCAIAYAVMAAAAGRQAAAPQPETSQDARRWQALAEVDGDIAAQVKRIAPFGQTYVDELAQKYLAIGDKGFLAQIADQIVSRAEAAQASQKAALQDRGNKFQGFRCFHDEQGRFIGEVSVESGDFHVFPSQSAFEEAVRDYITRGRPPITSRAIAPAPRVAAAE